MQFTRFHRALLTAALGVFIQASPAIAQDQYPNKPIRFIVPYPAGAGNDILARLIGQKMSETFKQPVIVDNKPGAAGAIGLDLLARSQPDGYTIGIADTGPLAINPALYPKLPFQPIKDFTPISTLVTFTYLLVVNTNVKADSVAELIALAKAQPDKINYASVGNGSVVHLATEMFKAKTDIPVVHVPYKASPEALQSIVAGETQMMFVNVQAAAPLLKAGKIRALAVVNKSRTPAFPNLPTMAEAGVSDFAFNAWFGIVAPANVPKPIVQTLNREVNRILQLPEIKEKFSGMGGVDVLAGTPEMFSALIQSETEIWGKLVRQTGAKVD